MALPVIPVTQPSDIRDLRPDQIGVCHLAKVYFPGVGHDSLHKLPARGWVALTVAALAEGQKYNEKWVLTCAGWGSALRAYATQYKAFFDRYEPGPYNPLKHQLKHQRVFGGVRYYLRRGQIPCAVPGSGWHPRGLAIDGALFHKGLIVAWRSNTRFWNWLKANVVSFGFSFEIAEEGVDDPHIRWVVGDKIPQRVLDIEQWIAAAGAPT